LYFSKYALIKQPKINPSFSAAYNVKNMQVVSQDNVGDFLTDYRLQPSTEDIENGQWESIRCKNKRLRFVCLN
jgi:hypothetical protein